MPVPTLPAQAPGPEGKYGAALAGVGDYVKSEGELNREEAEAIQLEVVRAMQCSN